MGRVRTARPVGREEYQSHAEVRQMRGLSRAIQEGRCPADNHGGRMRFMAKHAGQPWVQYTRTEQSSYSGPKTSPPPKPPRTRSLFGLYDPFILAAIARIAAGRRRRAG